MIKDANAQTLKLIKVLGLRDCRTLTTALRDNVVRSNRELLKKLMVDKLDVTIKRELAES